MEHVIRNLFSNGSKNKLYINITEDPKNLSVSLRLSNFRSINTACLKIS